MLPTLPRRFLLLLSGGLIAAACAGNAGAAINFSFEGSDEGGTGKATMSFADPEVDGTVLSVVLKNLSPLELSDNKPGANTPGITGFGFDLSPETLLGYSWKLTAYDADGGALKTIGSSDGACTDACEWGTGLSGIGSLEFQYLYSGDNVKGALYNPDAVSGFAAKPNYLTDATLTMTFLGSIAGSVPTNTFVRMQNVGKNGKGSLKLFGVCEDENGCEPEPPNEVPEPTGVALVALGFALGIRRRYNRSRQS